MNRYKLRWSERILFLVFDCLSSLTDMIFEALVVTAFAAMEIVGNAFLFLLAVFEKYGMDSKKRTIVNQLVSSVCFLTILDNVLCVPVLVMRLAYTPQALSVSVLALSGVTIHCLYMAYTFAEIIVLKCFYIQTWTRMAMLDDDFMSCFIIGFNFMMTALTITARVLLGEHNSNTYINYSVGNSAEATGKFEKTVNFYSTVLQYLVCLAILVAGIVVYFILKWTKQSARLLASPMSAGLNNKATNESIFGIGSVIIALTVMVVLLMPIFLCRHFLVMDGGNTLAVFFFVYSLAVIAFPGAYFVLNPKSLRTALKCLKCF